MRTSVLLAALLALALMVTACGTPATPVPNSMTREAQAALTADAAQGIIAVVPTSTPVPPTETPTPLPPTATPTEVPTEAPEAEEAEEPAEVAPQDPLVLLISRFGDPVRGQQLFNTTYDTNLGEYMCATCHLVDSDTALIGPGLLNLAQVAGERVEGQPAEVYVYRSIIYPDEYIVEGFAAGLMPGNYADLLSDQDLYDLSAYLLSLGN